MLRRMAGFGKAFRMRRSADRFGPRSLLTLDLGAGASKLVVMSRHQQNVRWEKALVLPPVDENLTFGGQTLAAVLKAERLTVEYASLLISTHGGLMRLMNFPGRPSETATLQAQVRQALGVEESFAVQLQVIQESVSAPQPGGGKDEFSLLAAALPSDLVTRLGIWLQEAGLRPVSLRVAGVASANLVRQAPGLLQQEKALGFLEIGADSSLLMLFHGTNLALARQFKFGSAAIIETLRGAFDMDAETAGKLFVSGSIDFATNIQALTKTWLHQVGISLDFFERRHGRPVAGLYLFGGGAQSKVVEGIIADHVHRPVIRWDVLQVFAGLTPPAGGDAAAPVIMAPAVADAMSVMRGGSHHAL